MADELTNLREALRGILAELPDLAVYKYPPSGGPETYPALTMVAATRDPRIAMGGSKSFTGVITCLLQVSTQNDEESFQQLDEFMEAVGPRSIEAVLEADTTWGGKVDWGNVGAISRTGWRDVNGAPFVMAEFQVDFLKQVL